MKKAPKFFLPIAILLAVSCTNDSESDLIESIDEEIPISFNATIRPIINNNCTACHSDPTQNGAPFPLTNYQQVLVRAQNGQLLGAMSRQTGEPRAMPPSGRLPQGKN